MSGGLGGRRGLWALALAGLCWALALGHARETRRLLRRSAERRPARQEQARRLAAVLGDVLAYERAQAGLAQAVATASPFDAGRWISERLPDAPPASWQTSDHPTRSGWAAQTLELRWERLALDRLDTLLQAAARENPPLRLVGLRVGPLPGGAQAEVELRLERLVATPSGGEG